MNKLLLPTLVVLCSLLVAFSPSVNAVDCDDCTSQSNTFWCSSTSVCHSLGNSTGNGTVSHPLPECENGWCSGESCLCDLCTKGIFPCSDSYPGLLILVIFYGGLLAFGAKLISDGSELLMEILNPGLIGGLLLPILGAVPDSAIIIVSGAAGSDPQSQVAVGVGTLAGSTIMLLTLPWAICLYLGKCDIKAGEALDGVNTKFSWTTQGISVDPDTCTNARIMMATSLAYFIVQGVAFAYLKDPSSGQKVEAPFALVGFLVCSLMLAAYCAYQVISPKLQEKKIREAKQRHVANMMIKRILHQMQQRQKSSIQASSIGPSSPLLAGQPQSGPVDVRAMGLKWKANAHKKAEARKHEAEGTDSKEEEEEEKVEGTPKQIAMRAAGLMLVGTAMVSFFSDPIVEVISDLGTKMDISVFFISFIVTPICSNASELISSFVFAAGKKRQNASLTYSQLYGAATMNNTMCLGIFFALIFFKKLTWEFSAETITIFIVTNIVGFLAATHTTLKLYYGPVIALLYPLSLVLVYLLETYAHWQ